MVQRELVLIRSTRLNRAPAQATTPSTRDKTFSIVVFSGHIGHTRMTAGRAKIARIWRRLAETLDIVGIQRIAGAEATVVSGNEGGPT
jgi:hypothetical protein